MTPAVSVEPVVSLIVSPDSNTCTFDGTCTILDVTEDVVASPVVVGKGYAKYLILVSSVVGITLVFANVTVNVLGVVFLTENSVLLIPFALDPVLKKTKSLTVS